MIRDPEYIRLITVKDFDHFTDHFIIVDEHQEPLFGNSLFFLKGQKWRDMRATLSPAFTGSKMKAMYTLVSECAAQMTEFLKEEAKKGILKYEMKEIFSLYTNDVIATTAFGIKVDSFAQPKNEFYLMGKEITNFSGFITLMKLLGFFMMPKLLNIFGITLFHPKTMDFYRNLVQDTMAVRQREGIIRPDMIHLLMQAKKGVLKHETQEMSNDTAFATVTESEVGIATNKREWTDDELTAQAVLFFFAGFDTTSTVLSFAMYELALNPDIQEILQAEIDKTLEQIGTPNYESIQSLRYLDMVVSETLRKWPPAPVTDRICTKPYTLTNTDGSKYTIEKNYNVFIPIMAIHHDPKYYDEPEKFKPERFNEENKKNIAPFTYMPFGVGPRNCIGSRFALMEAKAILFHLLSAFTVEVCDKTSIPLKLTRKSFVMQPEDGFWLGMKQRS